MIQTVDSLALAEKIARAADGARKRQEVLLEVNIGNEPQKSGVSTDRTQLLARDVRIDRRSNVVGLMADPADRRRTRGGISANFAPCAMLWEPASCRWE